MSGRKRGRAVVIGGGVAGLCAAHKLDEDGWDVLLLEKEDEVGGRCRSVTVEGFTFDTGAQHFHDSYDSILKTAIDLGMGERFRFPRQAPGLYSGEKLDHFVPRSLKSAILFPAEVLGAGALRDLPPVLYQLLRRYRSYNIRYPHWWKSGDGECAEEYLAIRTSERFRREFAEPVSLYALGAGPGSVSAAAFMVALRYTLAERIGSFAGGMGLFPDSLSRGLRVTTKMEAISPVVDDGRVVGVAARPTGGGRSRNYKADVAVCAVPAKVVESMPVEIGGSARAAAGAVEYSPHLVVNLGCLGGAGGESGPILLTGDDGFQASWICTSRSKDMENAPSGSTAVTVIYAGREASSLFDRGDLELAELASREAERATGVRELEFGVSRVDRHPGGRVIVSCGHAARLRDLHRSGSGVRGLYLAGDWVSSPTLEGAAKSGLDAAIKASGDS